MKKKSFDFLRRLMETISPAGFEKEAAELWREHTGKFVDEIETDVHGNVMGILNKSWSPRVMLAGHIDEVGYMIKYIDNEGYLYFATVGGMDVTLFAGQRIWIKTATEKVLGVIGKKPIHLLRSEERNKTPKVEDFWIDIGAKDKKEAGSLVDIGNVAVPAVGLERLKGERIVGRGFDDRAGAFVVSEVLALLPRKVLKASVYGVATVQEEVGLRGARTSAYGISPDIGIAIEVTHATDYPGVEKKVAGEINLGCGPVIARGPNINPRVFELLVEAAGKNKIPYQIIGIPRGTSTDANVIQLTKAGVATGLVSIPLRYMHTPVEVLNLKDIDNTCKLLSSFITGLSEKDSFKPY